MATNQTLKDQLAEKKEAKPLSMEENLNNLLNGMLNRQFKKIKNLVPKHMTPERICRMGLSATSRNPKLLECSPETIVGAIVNCASVGLEPNLLGHAYIVPFWNSKTNKYEAQMQIGYKGLLELIRRTGQVSTISAHEVYEGDTFEYAYGLQEKLVHIPCGEDDEKKITHFYACYKLKDGGSGFAVMTKNQVDRHRDKFTKSKTKNGEIFGPWKDHYISMALKTVLIKVMKYMPISIEQQETKNAMDFIQKDNGISRVKDPITPDNDAFIDTQYVVVDTDTGEVKKC